MCLTLSPDPETASHPSLCFCEDTCISLLNTQGYAFRESECFKRIIKIYLSMSHERLDGVNKLAESPAFLRAEEPEGTVPCSPLVCPLSPP